jgi:uncharacterized membrane protein YbaN (DUF454 family)
MRAIYSTLGIIFVIIGVIGIITPLLPTTPFLLLAAACFARGSQRFHQWLMTHPTLSKPIIDWQKNGVIRRPAKILATIFIGLNLAFPIFIINSVNTPMKAAILATGLLVLAFIWTRPSSPKDATTS